MKRVVMLLSHPLFGLGVESLLRQEEGLEIVGRETDPCRGIEQIRELRPDVVIVESAGPAGEPVPEVMRILTVGCGTRIVALNLQDNTMCVYRGEQRVIKGLKDLVEAIEQSGAP